MYCDILFTVDHKMSVEDFFRGVRQLDKYDVWLDMNRFEIDYGPDGEPYCSIEGEMPDIKSVWDALLEGLKDIDGFEIDFDGMREWL